MAAITVSTAHRAGHIGGRLKSGFSIPQEMLDALEASSPLKLAR